MATLRLILAGALAAFSLTAAAQAQQTPTDATTRIEANASEFLQKEGRGVYTGNVVVTRGDARLTTNKLTGICVRSAASAAGGAQDCDEIDPLIAEGDVLYTAPDAKIRGDKAIYQTGAGIITITGDVILSRADDCVMRGTEIVYNIDQGSVKVSAGNNRVFSICTPKKKDGAAQPAPAKPPN
ncbi:MAG TPA: LptA/OstA family protein [Hyphomonadaceae bacterium]|nr:LptA/OstA family protein [Hyphomonadaceae bacterium]